MTEGNQETGEALHERLRQLEQQLTVARRGLEEVQSSRRRTAQVKKELEEVKLALASSARSPQGRPARRIVLSVILLAIVTGESLILVGLIARNQRSNPTSGVSGTPASSGTHFTADGTQVSGLKVQNVTLHNNVEADRCTFIGRTRILGHDTRLRDTVVIGDLEVTGNRVVLDRVGVTGTVKITGNKPHCTDLFRFQDKNGNQKWESVEPKSPLRCSPSPDVGSLVDMSSGDP